MSAEIDDTSISAVIPAYNAGQYIDRAIESCLRQTRRPLEIFVVDDGSTDNTVEVASRFASSVKVIRKTNGGPASARNIGVAAANGCWIALLDADDWWFPTKLERQIAFGAPNVGLIHCLPDHQTPTPPPVLSFDDLWHRNWVINSSALIRRSALVTLGGFDEDKRLISVEDYNFWLRLAASDWAIVTCPEILVHYTRNIGLSSDADRFLAASLHNVDVLQARLGLDTDLVKKKRAELLGQFGRKAIHERKMKRARYLLWRSLLLQPSLQRLMFLSAASMPASALDIKRIPYRHQNKTAALRENKSRLLRSTSSITMTPSAMSSKQISVCGQNADNLAVAGRLDRPVLVTTVDAEESFDWKRPFERSSLDVSAMQQQQPAQEIFARHGVTPLYLVDFPVASQDRGGGPLRELLADGRCEIGAQLHPWVTPPFIEHVSVYNSFPGNLPPEIERQKLHTLTGALEDAFGTKPRVYRAGRYGLGAHTCSFLMELGFQADTSVMPRWSFTAQGGPDYRKFSAEPFWLDAGHTLLEIPISAEFVGSATGLRHILPQQFFDGTMRWHLPRAVMARTRFLERIKLSPEGTIIDEAKRLTRLMVARGHRIFVLTYHSPSLVPGNTPYVRNAEDLGRFLSWLNEFFDFFANEIRGDFASWSQVYRMIRSPPKPKPVSEISDLESFEKQ